MPKTLEIGEAKYAHLKYHAETIMGLEVTPAMNSKASIINLILGENSSITHVNIPDEDQDELAGLAIRAVPGAARVPRENAAHYVNDPHVMINIAEIPEDSLRARDVAITVMPDVWWLPRGQDCLVPVRVVLALQNALEMRMTPTDETDAITGRRVMAYKEVPSYPFSIVSSMPSHEQMAEFHARTDHVTFG